LHRVTAGNFDRCIGRPNYTIVRVVATGKQEWGRCGLLLERCLQLVV
jgi:hypothetical protein